MNTEQHEPSAVYLLATRLEETHALLRDYVEMASEQANHVRMYALIVAAGGQVEELQRIVAAAYELAKANR